MATNSQDIQLNDEQKRDLAALEQQTGRPWAVVFAEALRSYRTQVEDSGNGGTHDESAYEALSREGLIGCVEGGPSDLSTNPEYMEGFGESEG
jgi:hypothetical protein